MGYLSKKDKSELELQKDYIKSIESLESHKDKIEQLISFLLQKNYILKSHSDEILSFLEKSDSVAEQSKSPAMQKVLQTAKKVAPTDTTILLLGESGAGKSRLAKTIHAKSQRHAGPFITVSCGSIPETLLESELFGVEKGAFTGAVKSRPGRFQLATDGTLFLDEIGELTPTLQVKLLRAIQEKKIEPLGSGKEIEVDVRLIAATNRNLEKEVETGQFREDLYFRLNVVPMTLPPLRDRMEDLDDLIAFFLHRFESKENRSVKITDRNLINDLRKYTWPGNIRELENCIERLCVLAENSELSRNDLPDRIRPSSSEFIASNLQGPVQSGNAANNKLPDLQEMEKSLIETTLKATNGNRNKAAQSLGIHRNTLRAKMVEYGIQSSEN